MDFNHTWTWDPFEDNVLKTNWSKPGLKMTLTFNVICYNFVISGCIVFSLGENNIWQETSWKPNWIWPCPLCDLDCQGHIIDLAKIVIALLVMDIFDWYLDKRTLMTKPTLDFPKFGLQFYMTLTNKVK